MKKITAFFALLLLIFNLSAISVFADPLDEIVYYEIDAYVNEDATVTLNYYLQWKVLDSDSEGPLSWVKVGIPNSHYGDITALSDNIKSIGYDSSGGSNVRIDFDREYFEGEIIPFQFSVVQDYMYQVNKLEEGYTVYTYTPGWFDGITVDEMTVRWWADKATSWDPSCITDQGYLTWYYENGLGPGEKITLNITYPNDAYSFDLSKSAENADSSPWDFLYIMIGLAALFSPFLLIGFVIKAVFDALYRSSAGFGSGTEKKITRTKIVYFDSCPGCGAVRPEGKEKCEYCGRSLIKSQEVVEEKDIKKEDRASGKYDKAGLFKYTDSPNTYMRVNVVNVPRPRRTYSSFGSSGGGSSHHSSCAHSSCACACACACAGGGRAGCSAKNFYSVFLKKGSVIREK